MSQATLYVLSENRFDAEFFRVIVEKATGWLIPCTDDCDACHGLEFTGVGHDPEERILDYLRTLRAKARAIASHQAQQGRILLIAVRDNDRGPFAATLNEQVAIWPFPVAKTNRLRQLERCRDAVFTQQDDLCCAVGVCVQMLESWILLANDMTLTEADLPVFKEKSQQPGSNIRKHFGDQAQPPQLDDLYKAVSGKAIQEKRRDFNRTVAQNADLDSLATRSSSFKAFLLELRTRLPAPHA